MIGRPLAWHGNTWALQPLGSDKTQNIIYLLHCECKRGRAERCEVHASPLSVCFLHTIGDERDREDRQPGFPV
jgi:hypothetical protein